MIQKKTEFVLFMTAMILSCLFAIVTVLGMLLNNESAAITGFVCSAILAGIVILWIEKMKRSVLV